MNQRIESPLDELIENLERTLSFRNILPLLMVPVLLFSGCSQDTAGAPGSDNSKSWSAPVDPKSTLGWVLPDMNKMVFVPEGPFPWGDHYGDGEDSEKRIDEIYLDAFWIDAYETTNASYHKFIQATGHGVPRFANYTPVIKPAQPVVGVSWEEANAYCKWMNKRLPTEFEWEKAARGGKKIRYPWGDKRPDDFKVLRANLASGENFDDDGFVYAAPVGSYPENVSGYGMYDATGNVWEWTDTWFYHYIYDNLKTAEDRRNPKGPETGSYKAIRGGSWANTSWSSRVSTRFPMAAGARNMVLGFRCANDKGPADAGAK